MAISDSVPRQNTATIMAWKEEFRRALEVHCAKHAVLLGLSGTHIWNIQGSCSEQHSFRPVWRTFW